MAAAGAFISASGFSPAILRRQSYPAPGALRPALSSTRRFAASTTEQLSTASAPPEDSGPNGRPRKDVEPSRSTVSAASPFMEDEGPEGEGKSLEEFFDLARDLIRPDGGPPRWFSPLECGSRLDDSPLLLYLPGIDGTGAGLASQHKKLGKIFDVWCLHIPVMDRTPFTATSFNASQIQPLIPLLEIVPDQVQLSHPYLLTLMRGDPLKILRATSEKALPPQETVDMLSKDLLTMSSYVS
ncbi:hypothetical protein CRG98_019238 [Punica granatum]|uniref:Acyltransferase-like protein At3g26840, chloroplastic n=1 Tax=Punica granatum TaxID=22663 RepID=A0A2I0JVM3_PUNGR|nr:hypothetical protein CRG98_019238 [Punica granatum]